MRDPSDQSSVGIVSGINIGQGKAREIRKDLGRREYRSKTFDDLVETIRVGVFKFDPDLVENKAGCKIQFGIVFTLIILGSEP